MEEKDQFYSSQALILHEKKLRYQPINYCESLPCTCRAYNRARITQNWNLFNRQDDPFIEATLKNFGSSVRGN